ncbi:DUF1566 domain-containing protein [Chryseobacterium arthrosphaerae]|uniref:DUF1566 domain-containing protein n=1 Tax=Chryseobacterium arthrosphaerae TaxID=651561 RepID=UPI001F4B2173|nr:DUF1566 domain-containing protein [Chryseobacterium arthrosphaerae]MDG4651869.1 DUF1566 domain-containing protein [Chryseobacterium arthrosphaerae]
MIKFKYGKVFVFLSMLLMVSCSSDDVVIVEPSQVPKPVVGQRYKGGIVAYIFKSGDQGYVEGEDHGLIVTENDISEGIKWGPNYQFVYSNKNAIGQGLPNTQLIVAKFGQDENAAKLCYDLILNGYDDWYLPSFWELLAIESNKSKIGNMAGIYWSSSEWIFVDAHVGLATAYTAFTKNFTVYSPSVDEKMMKTDTHKVRAVRNF